MFNYLMVMDKPQLGLPFTKRTADRSDPARFLFSFFCDCCGKEWESYPAPFMSGGFTVVEHEYARQLLWIQEHREAFINANLEAHFHFNRCPVCGKCVCNDCFDEESGMCSSCASKSEN